MEEETVSQGPVVETEVLETLLAKAHLQQEKAPNPLEEPEIPEPDETNPLLDENEKGKEKPDMMPLFLAGGVVLIALAYGGYKFYKWACSSPASVSSTTTEMADLTIPLTPE